MKPKSASPRRPGWKALLPALALLAPRFDEAAFKAAADGRDGLVVIQVAR